MTANDSAVFEVIDSRKRKAKPCAILRYHPEEGFSVEIAPSANVNEVPAFFISFIERNELTIPNEWALRWVRERIAPPGRQNLGEILNAHGLYEYSELALLREGRGRSSQDDFIVREILPGNIGASSRSKNEERREAFGRSVRARREARGLSQRDLADALKIDQPALSRIESGKKNITFDLLADINELLDLDRCLQIESPASPIWDKRRLDLLADIDSISSDLGFTYKRLVDEIEGYSEEDPSAAVDSMVIAHCFRELMNSLPDYERGGQTSQGRQSKEHQALEKLNDALASIEDAPDSEESRRLQYRSISRELFQCLLDYKRAHEHGSATGRTREALALYGSEGALGPASLPWLNAKDAATSRAHLQRRSNPSIPTKEEYAENLANLELTIQTRLGHIFESKAMIISSVQRANRVDASGSYLKPDGTELRRVLAQAANRNLESWLFTHLKNPLWLEAMEDAKIFDIGARRGQGLDQFDLSPLGPFILRCVEHDPSRVLRILEKLTASDDYQMRVLLLKSAKDLPGDLRRQAAHTLTNWAKEDYGIGTYFWNVDDLVPLIDGLLSSEEEDGKTVDRLISQLVRLRNKSGSPLPEIVSCLPPHQYVGFVEAVLKLLPENKGRRLCLNQINAYIALNRPLAKDGAPRSRWLIPSIERETTVFLYRSAREHVLIWIRELKKLIRKHLEIGAAPEDRLLIRATPLVRRITLWTMHEHLVALSEGGSLPSDEIASALDTIFQADYLFDDEYEAEIMPLLKDYLRCTTEENADSLLASLPNRLAEAKGRIKQEAEAAGFPPVEAERQSIDRMRRLEFSILSQCEKERLPRDSFTRLCEHRRRFGEYDGANNPFESFTITGPNSPMPPDKLLKMGAENALKYLRKWQPTDQDRLNLVSKEGLERSIRKTLEEDPRYFEGYIEDIKGLPLIYLQGILGGWCAAVEAHSPIPTDDAAELCLWVSELTAQQPNDTLNTGELLREDAVRGAQMTANRLIQGILEDEEVDITSDALEKILRAIATLSATEGNEEQAEGWDDVDPLDVSLNARRPAAIGNAARWLYRAKSSHCGKREEALTILNSALPSSTSSPGDVVSLALQIPLLVRIERDWAEGNYDSLFGGSSPTRLQQLMLSTILSSFMPSQLLLDYLQPAMTHALRTKAEGYPSCASRLDKLNCFWHLGDWLYQGVVMGAFGEKESLLNQWLEAADAQTRGSVLNHLCALLENSPNASESAVEGIRRLWELHSSTPESLKGSSHLLQSHRLSPEWIKRALLQEAAARNTSDTLILIAKDINALAKDDPTWALAYLKAVIEKDDRIQPYKYEEIAPCILGAYAQAEDPRGNPDFLFCMDKLGREGMLYLDERLRLENGLASATEASRP